MILKEPKNLFLTSGFFLIVLGSILYSKPIIISIAERGFNLDRGFDLAQGLVLGAIATKKRLDVGDAFTPEGVFGPDKKDIIQKQLQQVEDLKSVVVAASSVGTAIGEVSKTVEEVTDTFNDISDFSKTLTESLGNITVAEVAKPIEETVENSLGAISNPIREVENVAKKSLFKIMGSWLK